MRSTIRLPSIGPGERASEAPEIAEHDLLICDPAEYATVGDIVAGGDGVPSKGEVNELRGFADDAGPTDPGR
jgi:hypothetical protein